VADRDIAESIREELAAIDPPRACCRAAEAAGLAGAFERRRRPLTRLALRLSRGRAVATGEPAGGASAGRARGASGEAGLRRAAAPRLGPWRPEAGTEFAWSSAADHCRAAWLRGRFLAHGSLSLSSGRTHLEFDLPVEEARELCDRLGEVDMEAGWRVRRGRGVVTWKSAETVGTFLRLLGAGSALLELESRQVSRSVRGDLNRFINAESANLQRAVDAAARQLEAIDVVESDGRLARQPESVRVVVRARRLEPEATLSELAQRTGLHRSAVQRALRRIEVLALHPADEPQPGQRRS
jgi:hypothetical protein